MTRESAQPVVDIWTHHPQQPNVFGDLFDTLVIDSSDLSQLPNLVVQRWDLWRQDDLGIALDAIHKYFFSAYGSAGGWYALEVDWKFDDKLSPGSPRLFIKQARAYPPPRSETKTGCMAR
jgi:hypothetical protein